jgi:serine/threonine-protein kinase
MGWGDVGCSLAEGRYRLIARVGSGGMAVVWRALDTVLHREVAIKVLNTEAGVDADRLKAEAQAIARLKHRHVTDVHDFGQDIAADGTLRPFVVMELVAGSTLQDLLAKGGAMPWPRATAVAAQVAAALAYAHSKGIVHRDVSSTNIILTEDGVKVLDFGIAALLGQPDSAEGEVLLGTPAYIAPERLRSHDATVMPAGDVYGLGVVWYQMMAGEMPWTARTATGLIQAHLVYMPAPLPPIDGLPDRLRELCMACLAKNPLDRPSSQELATELARYRDDPPPAPVTTQPIPRRPKGKRALVAVGVAAAAVLIAAFRPGAEQPQTPAPQAIATPLQTPSSAAPSTSAAATPGVPPLQRPKTGTIPASPDAAVSAPAPAPAPTSTLGDLVRAAGGTVLVVCLGGKAQVLNVATHPGYTIKDLKAGPADEVHIVLKSPQNDSDIKVTCDGAIAVPVVKENPK